MKRLGNVTLKWLKDKRKREDAMMTNKSVNRLWNMTAKVSYFGVMEEPVVVGTNYRRLECVD